ncbi:hypothetical protein CCP3SC1_780002 [Gammaproteobacteria bacterium]
MKEYIPDTSRLPFSPSVLLNITIRTLCLLIAPSHQAPEPSLSQAGEDLATSPGAHLVGGDACTRPLPEAVGSWISTIRFVSNDEHVSILIHNMPMNDADRCGRPRDHLAMLVEGINARVQALDAELARRAQHA